MIKFIEEKTTKDNKIIGIPYNTDPYTDSNGDERKYRFYFDDNQSINIIYQKRLFFISNEASVSIEILDTPPTKNTVFFLFDYIDAPAKLEDIKKSKIVSTGAPIGDKFLHYVNIGSCSESEGEFIENIKFGDEIFEIAADFHGQDESLEILLHNQGVSLPKDIIRSLYDTNIHEKYIDWVVLNRKYKELLLNIMDIVYKKGSYKSLVSSLGWFEYGDMIKLNEYWSDSSLHTLHQKDISTIYTPMIEEMMKMYMKTTFISIEYMLDEYDFEYIENDNGEVIDKRFKYDKDGVDLTVPILKDINEIQRKWSINDIALKMTLLGNYFSTYFMPIHMDLLFSSIENLVFTTPAKCKTAYSNIRTEDSYIGDDLSIILGEEPLSQYVVGDINTASVKFDDAKAFGYFIKNPAVNETDKNIILYCQSGAIINLPIRVISERVPIHVKEEGDKKVKVGTRVVKLDIIAESIEYQKKDVYKKYTYINDNNEEDIKYIKAGTRISTGEIIYDNINVPDDNIEYVVSSNIYIKTTTGYEKLDDKPNKLVFTLSIPVNFYINDINIDKNNENEYYELSLFTKRIGSYNLQIVAYDEYGRTAVSDKFPIKVVNPDYNHINIYQMKRIKNADEMKIHIFDTQLALNGTPKDARDIDITPGYVYRRSDNRIKMFYPDYVCNYISCCNIIDPNTESVCICTNWTGDENDKYVPVNINDFINTKSTAEEIIRGNIKAAGWDWTYREFKWVSNNNPNDPNDPADTINGKTIEETVVRLLILFSLTSNPITKCAIRPIKYIGNPEICKLTYYNDDINKRGYLYIYDDEAKKPITKYPTYRIPLFFDEKRFIPAFWIYNSEAEPSSKKEDAIYVAVPTNRNTYYTDNTWVITNESTGQEGIIKGLVSPIFWANNNRSNKNPRGIYSITLNTKYSNAEDADIETTTFKHAFKIE